MAQKITQLLQTNVAKMKRVMEAASETGKEIKEAKLKKSVKKKPAK